MPIRGGRSMATNSLATRPPNGSWTRGEEVVRYLHVVAIVDGCEGEMWVERADEGADGLVRRGQGVAAGAEEEETDRHVRSHMVAVGNLAGRVRWYACVLFKRHHYVHF